MAPQAAGSHPSVTLLIYCTLPTDLQHVSRYLHRTIKLYLGMVLLQIYWCLL